MGLFDDFIGIAKELNDIKDEFKSTAQQVVKEATGLTGEATNVVNDIKQGAVAKITEVKDQVTGTTGGVVSDIVKRPPSK